MSRRTPGQLRPARLAVSDTVLVAAAGLRTRTLRTALSALGIAIGVAAMVTVVGASASSQAEIGRQLDQLGTNLLTVEPGSTLFGEEAKLPKVSVSMVRRIGPVQSTSATGAVGVPVYRNDHIPVGATGSIQVLASQLDLLGTVGGRVRSGVWLNAATAAYPAVVLGSAAAQRMDIRTPGSRVWLGGMWFGVAGILEPVPLAAELDNAALVGWPAAQHYLGFDGHPTMLFCRTEPQQVEAVRAVLATTVNPASPNEVAVSRPSDALAAQRATDRALDALLLGLGAVALLVGGVGVANTMVISVLERRGEIGMRRALGAARRQVALQFVIESTLTAAAGGLGGVLAGIVLTGSWAVWQQWPVAVPLWAVLGGVAATLPIGAVAGLYPAVRAARLAPAQALADG